MLFLHEGNPGSGKSYDVQSRIMDALGQGRVVYSNVDGHDDQRCRQAIGDILNLSRSDLDARLIFLKDDQIANFWEHTTPGALVVIDEIHKWFNARDWTAQQNRGFANWCSTHRHEGYDLCMITQRSSKIDGQARSMLEWRYFYRKLNFFGNMFKNGYLVYCYSGDDAKPLSVKKCSYDVRYFKCYHSYKGNAIEKQPVKNANILKHPIFYGLGFVVCLFLYFFSQSTLKDGDILGTKQANAKINDAIKVLKAGGKPGRVAQAKAVGGEVHSSTILPGRTAADIVWLPVSIYMQKEDGSEVVMVGRYRLPQWLTLSEDKRLVLVDRVGMPPQITEGVRGGSSYSGSDDDCIDCKGDQASTL